MFQKNSIMSLKKKSKSLGHLTALNGVGPNGVGSPNFGSPRMKKHISVKNFNERLKFLNHSYGSSGNNNVGDSVDGATSPASEAMYHHHNRVQPQHPPPLQQPLRPHHAPPTRSTTALNLGTPIAQARADRAAADKAASASSAGKHTPKVGITKTIISYFQDSLECVELYLSYVTAAIGSVCVALLLRRNRCLGGVDK
jgi:hypothetical protein